MSVELRSGRSGQAALFAGALYRSAPAGSLVEVRFRLGEGMGRRFVEVGLLDRLVGTVLSLASRTDVYVGVVPRRRRGGGRRDLVERAAVVWVDCDSDAAVVALRRFRPLPGMVVGSGSGQNCHAYWFLDEPVELDVVERVNRRLAGALNADLVCADAARILRPVGSVKQGALAAGGCAAVASRRARARWDRRARAASPGGPFAGGRGPAAAVTPARVPGRIDWS